jgi:hypothetical protein
MYHNYERCLIMHRDILWHTVLERRLGMEDTINTPDGTIVTSDCLYIVNAFHAGI